MKLKTGLIALGGLSAAAFAALALVTRKQALDAITHTPEKRPPLVETPADYGLAFDKVTVRTADGLQLYGWTIPGGNGAAVLVMGGNPGGRQDGLFEAACLNRHGYTVLIGGFRAHDESQGDLVSYGYHEQQDIAAWHDYLRRRDDVDAGRIGFFGESMGGGAGILYAAAHEGIRAIATGSAFALTQETIETFINHELGPPPWLTPVLARFLVFWMEREAGFRTADLDTEAAIGRISPRPVFIIHGGADDKIAADNGHRLYAAAREPKELWFVPEAGHVNVEEFRPEEYAQRLVSFFDRHLLGD